tara:strand:- start:1410 stop:2888 length:1479 start_codon:yes stop_codon:yes gene_type:complete
MNLKELRNKIKNITDYNPEIQSYLDDLDELINDAYQTIFLSKRWTYAQATRFINIYPDLTSTSQTGVTRTVSVADGVRQITFSSAVPEFLEDERHWEGQIFELQGREYKILKIADNGLSLRVEEPLRCTANQTETDWKIKHRWYSMPEDCYDILYFGHRDAPVPANVPVYGKQIGLCARRDEELDLRVDYTSEFAEAYVNCSPWNIPEATKMSATVTYPAAVAGGLATGFYEFCWAFQKYGRVGSLSEPIITDASGTGQGQSPSIELNFSTWDDRTVAAKAYATTDVYPNNFEGFKKVLFYNENFDRTTGERRGLPKWRQVQDRTAVADRDEWLPLIRTDEQGSATITLLRQIDTGAPPYAEWDGQHLVVRPYPRPQGFEKEYASAGDLYFNRFRQFELRYQRKPLRLANITDSPQMPYEFHSLIVYRCLHEIFVKGGNMGLAGMYDKKYQDGLRELEKRYVDRTDTFWQKGQFGLSRTNIQYDFNSLRKLN